MNAAYYRDRARRCFREASECRDALIARMLDDLGREFEILADEIEARPSAQNTMPWPSAQYASWRSHRFDAGPPHGSPA